MPGQGPVFANTSAGLPSKLSIVAFSPLTVYRAAKESLAVIILLVVLGGAGWLAWQYGGERLRAGQLEQALERQRADYAALEQAYVHLIERSAITALVVRPGSVDAIIARADGTRRTVPTPYDPSHEIYVDYAVIDGRVLIRRIFDESTAPRDAVVLNNHLAHIDWPEDTAAYGQAIYRQLGEGTWVITVSGGGALGLQQVDGELPALINAPELTGTGGMPPPRKETRLGDILRALFE